MYQAITLITLKQNIMTTNNDLQVVLAKLKAAHTAPNRDVNEVAKYFTMANNLGANLKAFKFITNRPVANVWDEQKSYQ